MRPKQVFRQLLPFVGLLAFGCVAGTDNHEVSTRPRWTSRAIPEARGEIKEIDGKRVQVRYKEEPFSNYAVNYERWPTYTYTDTRTFPQPARVQMPSLKGDPRQGRQLFMARTKAPCTGCHLIPGEDVWPAGSVGPDLSAIGDRRSLRPARLRSTAPGSNRGRSERATRHRCPWACGPRRSWGPSGG